MTKVIEPLVTFKNKFINHKRVLMNAGTPEIVVRKPRTVDGVMIVEDTKELFPLYQYIQSFKDSCDIEVLLKRFKAGDQSVAQMFTQRKADDYMDLTEIPDNFNDMMSMINKGQEMFNELPAEVKAKFDNNYNSFVSGVGSDEWMDKMGFNNEKSVGEDAETVAAAENKDPA